MPRVGIICAGDLELEPFLPYLRDCRPSTKAMLTFYEGTVHGVDTAAVFCGVGKTNAALAAQILIDTYRADIIINSGTAGGMDRALRIFDTVIATEAAHHDVPKGILTEFHPWMPSIFFASDGTLLELSKKALEHYRSDRTIFYGRMVTGEKFITDSGRDEIIAEFNPLSVDMETASIAHVCYVNAIPFIAVRTITDTAGQSGEENFEKNCAEASSISKDIVLKILKEYKRYSAAMDPDKHKS